MCFAEFSLRFVFSTYRSHGFLQCDLALGVVRRNRVTERDPVEIRLERSGQSR